MKKLIFTIIAATLLVSLSAQEFSSFKPSQFSRDTNYGSFNYIQVNFFAGDHLTYPQGFEEAFSRGYKAAEFRLGWQSTGRQYWQRLQKYPVYGIGTFISSLGDSDVDSLIGAPSAIYFYYGLPIARFWRITAMFDLALGLSYDFNPYDPELNPDSDVIGSRVNLYANGNLLFMVKATERLDFSIGANFLHFSNGRTNTPQRGVNLAGLNVGAKYNFNAIKGHTKLVRPDYQPQIRPTFIEKDKKPHIQHGEVQFQAAFGTVETEPGEIKMPSGAKDTTKLQKRYYTTTLTVDYAHLIARKMKLHAGLDGMFDGSMENFIDGKAPQDVDFGGKAMLGYHFGFQYLIERFAFYYSLGFYAYKESETRGNWYMRVGGRIGLTENLDAHIALKTRNGGIADWIEWGFAYKLELF